MVIRLDFYVGERDLFGIGFSDNVILRTQYFLRATLPDTGRPDVYRHSDEQFAKSGFKVPKGDALEWDGKGWPFEVKGTGFRATCRIELDQVPETGAPSALRGVDAL